MMLVTLRVVFWEREFSFAAALLTNERHANVASVLASSKVAKTWLKKAKYKPVYLMQPKRFYV